MRLQGVCKNFTSDIDSKFTSSLWKELFVGLGKDLALNTIYHLQRGKQVERVNMILEVMSWKYFMQQ